MVMTCEVETRRASRIAYPCIGCGSQALPERCYCLACLRAAAEKERTSRLDPDAVLERQWLRREIE